MKLKKIIALTVLATTIGATTPAIANQNLKNNNDGIAIQSVKQVESKFGVGQGIIWPAQVNAPYADMVAWINNPNYSSGGAIDLAKVSVETGIDYFNLGFIQSTGQGVKDGKVDWGWGGYSVLSENQKDNSQYQGIKNSIKGLRDIGGDVTISFGGLNGVPFWEVTQDVDVLYNTYLDIVEGYGLTRLDLDIEGGAQDKEKNIANAKAIKKLQDKTGVDVVLTLPVLPSGLTSVQLNVLEAYLSEGVDIQCVNIMTMCYGSGTLNPGENYGTASLRAIDSTMLQVKDYYAKYANTKLTEAQAYAKLGTTPSIGYEGSAHPIFTTEWTKLVVDHAIDKKIGMTSCWSINRDAKLDNNQGVNNQFEFASIFKKFGITEADKNSKPVISGVGNLEIKIGDKFDKMAGVTANDKEDGILTSKIKVIGDVDTNKAGKYTLTYSVEDSKGAITSVQRIITVKDSSGGQETANFDFKFDITSDWGSGANYKIVIKNNSGKDITNGWNIEFDFDKKLNSAWSCGFANNGNKYTFTNPEWNKVWKAGDSIEISGASQGGIGNAKPENIKVNGILIGDGIVSPPVNPPVEPPINPPVKPEIPPVTPNETLWSVGKSYKIGDIAIFNEKKYECRQNHISLQGWEPNNVLALWSEKK